MQHIASRESLERDQAERARRSPSRWTTPALHALGSELDAVSDLLLSEVPLRRTLSEGTLCADTRSGIAGGCWPARSATQRSAVVQFAVRQPWSSSRDLQEALRRVSRTAMFLQAERTGELDDVEDQLFRFSRIVDASPELSVILDDPTADPDCPVAAGRPAAGRPRRIRWSPNWSTPWPGTPPADRSPTACANWSTRPRSAGDKVVAIVTAAVAADRTTRPSRLTALAEPDLRQRGLRARRGRPRRWSAGSGCRSATR